MMVGSGGSGGTARQAMRGCMHNVGKTHKQVPSPLA